MNTSFKSEQEIANAISLLSSLREHPAWLLVQSILDENLEFVRGQLEDEGGSKDDVDRLRIKISIFKQMRSLPENIINSLQTDDPITPNSDPYDSVPEKLIASRT